MPRANYSPTESKYKGGADEMFITYELPQKTRGGDKSDYPKVKRVYIAGEIESTEMGDFEKKSGKQVHGMKIEFKQRRQGYERAGYTAEREDTGTEYDVAPTTVESTEQRFTKIVELPEQAHDVKFFNGKDKLPDRYRSALQDIT